MLGDRQTGMITGRQEEYGQTNSLKQVLRQDDRHSERQTGIVTDKQTGLLAGRQTGCGDRKIDGQGNRQTGIMADRNQRVGRQACQTDMDS